MTVRRLIRTMRSWPVGARKLFVVALASVLAMGTLVATAPNAYAAVTELRAALKVGASLPSPLVASGSNLVVGLNRSTNSGASWATDGTLTAMQESGTWLSAYNGVMYGISGSGGAVAYTIGTGTAVTSTLPAAAWSQMNSSWVLSTTATGGTAYNYSTLGVTGVNPASGSYVYGSLSAQLAPSSVLVWRATSTDTHTIFSVASSPTVLAGAWVTIDGIKDWVVNATQLVYALDTGTGLQVCSRPLTNLSAAPTCVMAWAGSHTAYGADLYVVGSSAFLRVANDATGVTTWYLWNGTTVVGVQVPAGSSIDSPFLGDTAYVVVRDADSVPSFKKVNADGTLSAGFANPATAVSTVEGLAVAPGRILGSDNSDASNQTFPAWSRTVSGSALGVETALLPKRASGLAVSARRTAVSNRDGLSLLDGSTVTHTFSDAHLGQLSGPYVAQPLLDASFNPYVLVSKADGAEVARFTTSTGVLFGSRYLSFNSPSPTGAVSVTIKDLTATVNDAVVPLAPSSASCAGWVAWNDLVAATCDSGHAVRAFNLVDGHLVASTSSTEALLSVKELGDGYAVIYGSQGYQLWDLSNNPPTPLVDCLSWTVSDGIGHVACSSSSELIWRDYSSLATSPGRVLGWSATPTFSTTATLWTPEIDVSKPFNAGTLRIKQGTTTIKDIPVPASIDGSVRGVTWDGKNTAGVLVPAGTYTAELIVAGTDGSGAVRSIDGGVPTFQVTRRVPGSFVALTPSRVLDTRVESGGAGPVVAYGVLDLQITGRGGVPIDGVGAVILNVTAVTPKAAGFLSVFPAGQVAPNASNLNFVPGQVVPNLVVAKVGTDGKVSIRNGSPGATELVADVAGYFVAGTVTDPGGVTAVAPSRLLETRVAEGGAGPLVAYGTVTVQAAGRGGVPATGVSAVVVNLTAVTPLAAGFLTAYPTGTPAPNASNVNFTPGQVVPNLAFVKLAADGSFSVRNGSPGKVEVVADVAGYVLGGTVASSGMFVPVSPARVLDTRSGGGGALAPYATRSLTVAGVGGVAATGVSGIVVNVTVVAGGGAGYLTVYPADTAAPLASNLNFTPGQIVPNLVASKTSAAGAIAIFNASPTASNVIADVAGYFTS